MVLAHCGSLLLDPAALQEVSARCVLSHSAVGSCLMPAKSAAILMRQRSVLRFLQLCFELAVLERLPKPPQALPPRCYPSLFSLVSPQVCHELTVLERLHKAPDFSPAATQEALTKRPLRLC